MKKQGELLGKHQIPVVLGPDKRHYVVDHHHLARALHDEGVKDILVSVIADLTMVDRDAFWGVMDNKRWVYPYDAKGERRHFRDIPHTVADLKDDPFRSLAGELRRIGGFAKDTTPFSEFLWADFLRRNLSRKRVEADFDKALEKALALAKGKDRGLLAGLVRAGVGRLTFRRTVACPVGETGDASGASSLPPSVRCSQRSSGWPASSSRPARARPAMTIRQCPTPQAMPAQAASHAQAALVSP